MLTVSCVFISYAICFKVLDEDRYGMPRRRRASPEWQRGRLDERDSSLGGHRYLCEMYLF